MISHETIERIRDAAHIDEVVSEFVNLKRRGANLLGLCPFHNERTPSFTVSPVKGFYKCFGCGASGDAVKFIMEHEHYTYPDALRFLAKKYHIEIEETTPDPQFQEEQSQKETLFTITTYAANVFMDNLWNNPKGKAIGLSYFHERGFSDDTIRKFQLGYAIDEWTHFTDTAIAHGFELEHLKAAGLTSSGDRQVDVYRGRVMFPIHSVTGRVLGFGGRTLKADKNIPKYINSPESDIYNKSQILFGLFFARNTIVKENNCFLVEGYTDVISLHQAGIENVVASSGTSLTTEQINLIKRYTNLITVLFDGDAAGIKASFRGIDMILETGMHVQVVLFPDGEDPDSFARKMDKEALHGFLEQEKKDFIRFKAAILMKDADQDPIKKGAIIKDIIQSIAIVPDGIMRNLYIQQCAQQMHVDEQVLFHELNKERRSRFKRNIHPDHTELPISDEVKTTPAEQVYPIITHTHEQEKELLRLILNYGDRLLEFHQKNDEGDDERITYSVFNYIQSDLIIEEIRPTHPVYAAIFDEMCKLLPDYTIEQLQQYFIRHHDDTIRAEAINLISPQYMLSPQWQEKYKIYIQNETDMMLPIVQDALHQLKVRRLNQMIESEKLKLNQPLEEEDMIQILEKIKHLEIIKKVLSDELSTVIYPK
ncbi:MAG: DNA primase [Flavobacteriales bacterium]|nr:DNA primase [Flavobacteriales bacterium]